MYLAEAEDIKKRWQEYTELYKKGLNDPDNYDGVIIHLTIILLRIHKRTIEIRSS